MTQAVVPVSKPEDMRRCVVCKLRFEEWWEQLDGDLVRTKLELVEVSPCVVHKDVTWEQVDAMLERRQP